MLCLVVYCCLIVVVWLSATGLVVCFAILLVCCVDYCFWWLLFAGWLFTFANTRCVFFFVF